MTSLMIKDLSIATDLDHDAMTKVRGGYYKGAAYCLPAYCAPVGVPTGYGAPKHEFAFDASQVIGQSQNVVNNNGNNVAFAHGITSDVKPVQTANNNISF